MRWKTHNPMPVLLLARKKQPSMTNKMKPQAVLNLSPDLPNQLFQPLNLDPSIVHLNVLKSTVSQQDHKSRIDPPRPETLKKRAKKLRFTGKISGGSREKLLFSNNAGLLCNVVTKCQQWVVPLEESLNINF